jgi:glycosyltransferase involved in cell wall biosynthesis
MQSEMEQQMTKPLRVLYINHYGIFGGAQRSILELVFGFPRGSLEAQFISPEGTVTPFFKKSGLPYYSLPGITKFDHTRLGYYRGLRWLILLRELVYLFPTLYVFWRFRKKVREFDIVHINEITCILPLILAKKVFRKPIILHARAVFNNDPNKWRTRMLTRIFQKYPSRIIAIDQTIAASIPVKDKLSIVHNSFSFESLFNTGANKFAETLSKIPKRRINIGYIGAIHRNKGVFDLLVAMKMCRDNGLDVSLIIAGNGNSGRRILRSFLKVLGISQDMNFELMDYIDRNELENHIHPLGFSTNTSSFYQYIDVVCFPTHYNSVGRPVFEAAFFKKPSIVAIENPYPDTLVDGKTGLRVDEKNPGSIFAAIKKFYDDPKLLTEMGEEAQKLAVQNFDLAKNVSKVQEIYSSVLTSE